MLDTTEITTLERRWKRYKYKSLAKQFFVGIVTITIVSGSVYYYLKNYAPIYRVPTPKITFEIPKEVPKQSPIEPISKQTSLQNETPIPPKTEDAHEPNKPINKTEIKESVVAVSTTVLKLQPVQEYHEPNPIIKNQPPKLSHEASTQPKIEKKQEIAIVEPREVTTTQPVEKKIDIKTQEVETTSYLKEKFYATHNIVFALMLSEEFYYLKDYKNALQWALSANEIDPQNERSWILFAKAKAKLGAPNDAIKALNVFQQSSPSSKINVLIKKIQSGDY